MSMIIIIILLTGNSTVCKNRAIYERKIRHIVWNKVRLSWDTSYLGKAYNTCSEIRCALYKMMKTS